MTDKAPSRAELRAHLLRTRIAGDVATSRENNLRNIGRLARGEEHWTFGLTFGRRRSVAEILALMADRVGIHPDSSYGEGQDRIDPDRTLAALDAMATRLRAVARSGARVLLATGHPAGLLPVYLGIGAALHQAGARLLEPAAGWSYRSRDRRRELRWVCGVGMVSDGGGLAHTHDAAPMRAMLDDLAAMGEGPPELVVADHGYAGAAAEAGVPTVGFADCNDPALFVGAADGKVAAAVPLDDNVAPHHYRPVTNYLVRAARLDSEPRPGDECSAQEDKPPIR
jgi:hypothetical protein